MREIKIYEFSELPIEAQKDAIQDRKIRAYIIECCKSYLEEIYFENGIIELFDFLGITDCVYVNVTDKFEIYFSGRYADLEGNELYSALLRDSIFKDNFEKTFDKLYEWTQYLEQCEESHKMHKLYTKEEFFRAIIAYEQYLFKSGVDFFKFLISFIEENATKWLNLMTTDAEYCRQYCAGEVTDYYLGPDSIGEFDNKGNLIYDY